MLTPRHYQVDGINWLTTPNVRLKDTDLLPTLCRHILADAPGSGKTFQASEAALALSSTTQSKLVLAPAHLCKQWFVFLQEQYPSSTVVWLEGSRANKEKDAKLAADWYIVSIQSLRQWEFMEKLLVGLCIRQRINVAVIDESHYCKNRDAIQSKLAKKITRPEFINHVILLSATPIMKEADDLYWQLHICDPLTHSSYYQWLQKYCWCTMTAWGPQDVTLKRTADFSQWMMGRTYKEIGLELPPIIPSVHVHQMTPARKQAYKDIKDYWYTQVTDGEGLSANSAMEVMHLLRRITNSPEKQADLTTFLQDDPKPALIACAYRVAAKELSAAIRKAGFTATVITGEIPADDRVAIAKQPTQVIVATIPSLSEGCDLSHCNSVYFYEEDWAPGKHQQFLSRVRRHRDNANVGVTITEDNHLHVDTDPNDRPVILRYFHAANTIDTRIHAVRDHRQTNIKDLIKSELGV